MDQILTLEEFQFAIGRVYDCVHFWTSCFLPVRYFIQFLGIRKISQLMEKFTCTFWTKKHAVFCCGQKQKSFNSFNKDKRSTIWKTQTQKNQTSTHTYHTYTKKRQHTNTKHNTKKNICKNFSCNWSILKVRYCLFRSSFFSKKQFVYNFRHLCWWMQFWLWEIMSWKFFQKFVNFDISWS